MADKDIKIGIVTTADTAGVEKTTAAFTGLIDKVSVGQWGVYDLDAAFKKVTPPLEEIPGKGGKASAAFGKMGQVANQASYQITDFATQVSMGTSAITAFSQQAPQLIGTFSASGLLSAKMALGLSAISVAIPITVIGLRLLTTWLGNSAEASEKTEDRFKKLGDEAVRLQQEKLKSAREEMELVQDEADALKGKFGETIKASDEYKTASLKNQEVLRDAEKTINELLGERIKKLDEIARKEAEAAAMRKREAESALAAQQERLTLAQEAVEKAAQRKANLEKLAGETQAELDEKLGTLQKLRDMLAETQKTANDPLPLEFTAGAQSDRGEKMDARIQARNFIVPLEGQISRIEDLVNDLVKTRREEETKLRKADATLNAALSNENDIAEAVRIKSEEIVQTFEVSGIKDATNAAKERSQALASELKDAVGKIETNTTATSEIKERILKATADGVIAVDEQRQATDDFTKLIIEVRKGNAKFSENVTKLTELQNELLTMGIQNSEAIRKLEERLMQQMEK